MSDSLRYYKVTGKSAAMVLAGMKAQRKASAEAIKWAKSNGAENVYRRGVSVDFIPWALKFSGSPDGALWARAERGFTRLYRPRKSAKARELREKFHSFASKDLGKALESIGIESEVWSGFAISSPGLNVVGRAVYVTTRQTDIKETKDIKRVSDIEFERATSKKRQKTT